MVDKMNETDAALDSIYGKAPGATETSNAFRREAINALQGENAETQTLTLRMAQNVFDCHPLPLTEERLMGALNSANLKAKVELIRKGSEKLKSSLPCIFWQGTLDMAKYAEAVKMQLERGEKLPSAINKDKYFTLATPFCFIDIDQPHTDDEGSPFDPFILFGKVQHHAPSGEVVFAQATARRGLRLVVKRNDRESLKQIQERYGEYAGRAVDVLLDYTRRSFLTSMEDVYLMDVDAICKPFSMADSLKWKALDECSHAVIQSSHSVIQSSHAVIQSSHSVIQSEAKNLGNTNVDVLEILPPFGRLNDNMMNANDNSKAIAQTLDELLGGEAGEGSRHNRYMRILGYMRHLLPSVEALTASCGYEDLPLDERERCAKDVLNSHPTASTPRLLTEAIAIANAKKQAETEAEEAAETPARDDEPMLPQRLPKPLQVLTKKVHPLLYPCVIRSAFAAFATHLEGVRIRYENGTENEMPIVHLCVAGQGSRQEQHHRTIRCHPQKHHQHGQ